MAAANASLGDLRTWTHHVYQISRNQNFCLYFLFCSPYCRGQPARQSANQCSFGSDCISCQVVSGGGSNKNVSEITTVRFYDMRVVISISLVHVRVLQGSSYHSASSYFFTEFIQLYPKLPFCLTACYPAAMISDDFVHDSDWWWQW